MFKTLHSLKFELSSKYDENLGQLIALVDVCEENSIIVAPELVFSGFDYDNFEEAAAYSSYAIEQLLLHVSNKTLIFTTIEKRAKGFYNFAKVLHKGEVIYEQAKAKLFTFGGEHHYFKEGSTEAINIITIEGVKVAILICFELRFQELWKRVEGADIIAVPAFWGKNRAKHFKTLTNALALINQCYVIASDATSDETGGDCGIITPFGVEKRNDTMAILSQIYRENEIRKMRRYMNVGI